jgi:hypothetical protein
MIHINRIGGSDVSLKHAYGRLSQNSIDCPALRFKSSSVYKYVYMRISMWLWFFRRSTTQHTRRQILEDIFSCRLDHLPIKVLTNLKMGIASKSAGYWRCLKKSSKIAPSTVMSCLPLLGTECGKSRYRVVKTIRMAVQEFTTIMDAHPNLKIIHLIRDPRAMISSRNKILPMSNLTIFSNTHCRRVMTDMAAASGILRKFPNATMRLLYEDMASRPVDVTTSIYSFLGLTIRPRVIVYVVNITSSGLPDNGVFNTVRRNSSKHIDSWKGRMDDASVHVIDSNCIDLYTAVGYTTIN